MLRNHGFPEHELSDYIGWVGNGARKLVVASLPRDRSFSDEEEQACLDEYLNIYAKSLINKSRLYEGIEETLDILKKYEIPMAINTNKPHHLSVKVYEYFLRKWNFHAVVGSRAGLAKKPDPQGALSIAKSLSLNPENILYVGDSQVDIQTAHNGGMMFVGVTWGYGHPEVDGTSFTLLDSTPELARFFIEKLEKA